MLLEDEQRLSLDQFAQATDGGEEPAADEPGEPEEPTLDDLDEATRARVDAYNARQQETQRQTLQAYGLDLARDGSPVIADPSRFSAWSGINQQPQRQQQPAPAPAPAAAPEPEEPPLDPLSMTAEDLQRAIDRMVEKRVAPLAEQNQRLMATLQRRAAGDAFASVRQSLEKYGPEIAGIVDDPSFAESYRLHAANFNPQDLESPQVQESIALSLAPWLLEQRRSNARPAVNGRSLPDGRGSDAPDRDAQGRFTPRAEVAREMANRATLGQVAPARGGMAPPQPADRNARIYTDFIDQFSKQHPTTAKFAAPTAADLDALEFESIIDFQNARKAGGRR